MASPILTIIVTSSLLKWLRFEALNRRKYKTLLRFGDLDEALITRFGLIQETTKNVRKIQEHIKAAQSEQNNYADKRRIPLEFDVRDKGVSRVSPFKSMFFIFHISESMFQTRFMLLSHKA